MAPMAWQVALLALLAATIDRLTRRRLWPDLRLALWMLVIVRLAIPPSWSSSSSLASLAREIPLLAGSSPSVASRGVGSPSSDAGFPLSLAAFALWVAGIAACAILELRRHRRLRRELASEPQPIRLPRETLATLEAVARRMGISRVPSIAISRRFASPAVIGVFRPCVILPERLILDASNAATSRTELASERACRELTRGAPSSRGRAFHLEHVLMRELAHVRRRDLLAAAVIRVLAISYWFHPAIWFAQRELAGLREVGCDATVSSHLRERTWEYRDALIDTARAILDPGRPAHWSRAEFWHGQSQLLLRLAALEQPVWRFAARRRAASIVTFALIAVFVLPMAECRKLEDPRSVSSATRGILPRSRDDEIRAHNIAQSGDDELRARDIAQSGDDGLRARDIDAAIANLSRVADGGARQSCLRLQCSATLLANAQLYESSRSHE
jgi:beta-lactamase regulating signal transducer with metallopeptidase domain